MCPPTYQSRGFVPNPPHVSLWGMPVFVNGGMVEPSHMNIPSGILPPDDPDRVLTRLMPGELVVPVKHVKLVASFLKKNGINLKGM
jgi:hypothetical protein